MVSSTKEVMGPFCSVLSRSIDLCGAPQCDRYRDIGVCPAVVTRMRRETLVWEIAEGLEGVAEK